MNKQDSPLKIFAEICDYFNRDVESVAKKGRNRENVVIRQIYFSVATISHSLNRVRYVVNLDHSTVIYGRKVAVTVEEIRTDLKKVVETLYPDIDYDKLIKGELWRKSLK